MKKILKIILAIVGTLAVITLIAFSPYIASFIFTEDDFKVENDYEMVFVASSINEQADDEGNYIIDNPLTLHFHKPDFKLFNYYGINYTADCYVKATLTYQRDLKEYSEDFFLEPSEKATNFYSFTDDFLDSKKGNKPLTLTLNCLNADTGKIKINGFSVFNREIPAQEIFTEADNLKIGVDLLWGGALSYVEDLNSNVEAVKVNDTIKVDSNASERYKTEAVNQNVNLINRNDTGRLVQQSYYGTLDYDHGVYMENDWKYNPVQGGNQFNDHSKIVDLRITDNEIYIKCRPLDWAKEKEFITPSYMEAWYTIENGTVHTTCRFVDFSGYPEADSTQEIPAFYCVAPLENFVYYAGDKPWTDDKLSYEKDLIFWPDAGYPTFHSKENWAAFTGEFDDSFGIGIYVPNEEEFLTGIFERGKTTNEDPSRDGPTSYIAITKARTFRSFEPFSYEYYLATGDAQEIRSSFKEIAQK